MGDDTSTTLRGDSRCAGIFCHKNSFRDTAANLAVRSPTKPHAVIFPCHKRALPILLIAHMYTNTRYKLATLPFPQFLIGLLLRLRYVEKECLISISLSQKSEKNDFLAGR